ncbi:hypothetical protein CB1_001451011 [Camelus ferus]|nr:hypothetical protein CB1_001451011 [Camelus ferus]
MPCSPASQDLHAPGPPGTQKGIHADNTKTWSLLGICPHQLDFGGYTWSLLGICPHQLDFGGLPLITFGRSKFNVKAQRVRRLSFSDRSEVKPGSWRALAPSVPTAAHALRLSLHQLISTPPSGVWLGQAFAGVRILDLTEDFRGQWIAGRRTTQRNFFTLSILTGVGGVGRWGGLRCQVLDALNSSSASKFSPQMFL